MKRLLCAVGISLLMLTVTAQTDELLSTKPDPTQQLLDMLSAIPVLGDNGPILFFNDYRALERSGDVDFEGNPRYSRFVGHLFFFLPFFDDAIGPAINGFSVYDVDYTVEASGGFFVYAGDFDPAAITDTVAAPPVDYRETVGMYAPVEIDGVRVWCPDADCEAAGTYRTSEERLGNLLDPLGVGAQPALRVDDNQLTLINEVDHLDTLIEMANGNHPALADQPHINALAHGLNDADAFDGALIQAFVIDGDAVRFPFDPDDPTVYEDLLYINPDEPQVFADTFMTDYGRLPRFDLLGMAEGYPTDDFTQQSIVIALTYTNAEDAEHATNELAVRFNGYVPYGGKGDIRYDLQDTFALEVIRTGVIEFDGVYVAQAVLYYALPEIDETAVSLSTWPGYLYNRWVWAIGAREFYQLWDLIE